MNRSLRLVIAALCIAPLLAACGGNGDDDASGGTVTVTEGPDTCGILGCERKTLTESPTTIIDSCGMIGAPCTTDVAECEVGQIDYQNGNGCVPCEDFEGCFDQASDMQYFFDWIVPRVQEFSKRTYQAMPEPDHWLYIPAGVTGPEACTNDDGSPAAYSDESYEYCPLDNTVYVGEALMWMFYTDYGDAAPAVAMAHEWGHHVQNMVGVDRIVRTQAQTINEENQADCVAGAWAYYMAARNFLNGDDMGDVGKIMLLISDAENDQSRSHGTLSERSQSFVYGFENEMTGCNDYFPNTPLLN